MMAPLRIEESTQKRGHEHRRRAARAPLSGVVAIAGAVLPACLSSCYFAQAPPYPEKDATMGIPPEDFRPSIACRDWELATEERSSLSHTSFPELAPEGCFVRVRYGDGPVHADPIPAGCGYPDESSLGAIERRAATYEIAATSLSALRDAPLELDCQLPDDVRRSAAMQNARTLRSLASSWSNELPLRKFPYAVVGTFGFGAKKQDASVIARWKPADDCIPMGDEDLAVFDLNVARARRAAEAYHAHVAPLVTLSGGAVHSSAYEAFFLTHLLSCRFGVPKDRIIVDPCADHTHTNVRNTGGIVVAIGGRVAYVVTDDGGQAAYLQDWTVFDLLGGSIDQRARRDFGYSLGAWRQASVGMHAGFWYTPFRFWAAAHDGLGGFSCMDDERASERGATRDTPFVP